MDQSAYQGLARTENDHWWYVGRREMINEQLMKLKLPDGAQILEVGTGTGGNLAMLAAHGNLSAMEFDRYAREFATQRSGIQVLEGSLPSNIPFNGKQFDLICLFDVLEHVEDDIESLRSLSRLLNQGGRLMVTVPAYDWMWSDHDVVLHHFRRYSRDRLARTVSDAGLNLTYITNFNTALLPMAVAARLFNVVTGRKGSPGLATPPKPINLMLKSIFRAERYVSRLLSFRHGLSIMAIIEK